jgi:hypothetical protein
VKPQDVAWPAFFEPRHLLCGPPAAGENVPRVVALTPRGFGALATIGGTQQAEAVQRALPFALDGVGEFGPLAGASWSQHGLELVTQVGKLLICPGHAPAEHGAWLCKATDGPPLPMPSGTQLIAAAVGDFADVADGMGMGRRLAMVHKDFPGTVSIFAEEGMGKGWNPVGEMHLPQDDMTGHAGKVSLAFANHELLIIMGNGVVHRRDMFYGTHAFHPAPAAAGKREFHAVCSLPKEGLLRLALRPADARDGSAWVPELLKGL